MPPINTKQELEPPKNSFLLTTPLYSLSNLVLPDSTMHGIQDFLTYQTHESLIFDSWGLSQTHSNQRQIAINLYGLPGTGKTMAAHAIAKEMGKQLIVVNYSEIESKYVGETSKNLTNVFKEATDYGAVIFFDEADAMLSRRVTNMSNATDVSVNQTRSVLLKLMDNHKGLIIFTTNFIENYDPAFMRRILSHILFELPNLENRKKLWRHYIPRNRVFNFVDFEKLAEISENLSGSDISNCVLKATLSAARENSSEVHDRHFLTAIEEVRTSRTANSA